MSPWTSGRAGRSSSERTIVAETATSDAPQLHSAVDPHAVGFVRNAQAHRALVAELNAQLATARLGGPQRARTRHTDRGKLLPRDRVDGLLDPGYALPRAVAVGRRRPLRRRGTCGRPHHRDRSGRRAGCRDRRQRRHRQGRHVLPDDGRRSTFVPRKSRSRTTSRASTWSTRAEPSSPPRTRCSPIASATGRIFFNQAAHVQGRHRPDRRRHGCIPRQAVPTSRP